MIQESDYYQRLYGLPGQIYQIDSMSGMNIRGNYPTMPETSIKIDLNFGKKLKEVLELL